MTKLEELYLYECRKTFDPGIPPGLRAVAEIRGHAILDTLTAVYNDGGTMAGQLGLFADSVMMDEHGQDVPMCCGMKALP
jgi:hypothetical protein